MFADAAFKDSEYILYLLPWLLSMNHPKCPGYIEKIEKIFRVAGIDRNEEIRKRAEKFKRLFHVDGKAAVPFSQSEYCLIEGVYTIGSIGTVGQTASSDCDIWICYDKNKVSPSVWKQLHQKVNLIKDWLDGAIRIPVYFFICDVNDIRQGIFGSVDAESSGSMQKDLLKEEFYRTTIVIAGKIPLWWVCDHDDSEDSYPRAVKILQQKKYSGGYQGLDEVFGDDLVDLGDLETIDEGEYFGAALWQLQKALKRPLKSIIKMLLIKMQFDVPHERLLCYRFRDAVLQHDPAKPFPDPLSFMMAAILIYCERKQPDLYDLLKVCFYLRCDITDSLDGHSLRNRQLRKFFTAHPIYDDERRILDHFKVWNMESQIELGHQLFKHLIQIYNEIAAIQQGISSKINRQDLIVLGRKIAACYQKKSNKIQVIPKPDRYLNLSTLTLRLKDDVWRLKAGNERLQPLFSSHDIIQHIAFIIWNDLLVTNRIRMEPNSTSVTLQEIINLGKEMKNFFGICNVFNMDYMHYLKQSHIIRLMIVVSFEKNPWEKDMNDLAVVYTNSWGEMFVERFKSPHLLDAFFRKLGHRSKKIETSYYLQRNCTYYSKVIERTKKIISILK
jgi:adenylate cyclase class 1